MAEELGYVSLYVMICGNYIILRHTVRRPGPRTQLTYVGSDIAFKGEH